MKNMYDTMQDIVELSPIAYKLVRERLSQIREYRYNEYKLYVDYCDYLYQLSEQALIKGDIDLFVNHQLSIIELRTQHRINEALHEGDKRYSQIIGYYTSLPPGTTRWREMISEGFIQYKDADDFFDKTFGKL